MDCQCWSQPVPLLIDSCVSPWRALQFSLGELTTRCAASGLPCCHQQDLQAGWLVNEETDRAIGHHPSCMNQAIRRDQVCPQSNKGLCLSHPLFVRYKPDPFYYTANLRLPPSLVGIPTSWMPNCLQAKVWATLQWQKIWMCSVLNKSPNFVWESAQ